MNYYINEYSIRGQFEDVDEFFESLRIYTIPILKKIEEDEDSVIWKKDDLWNAKICGGITISNIPIKKNERTPMKTIFINKMIKLARSAPYWSELDEEIITAKEYRFDEEYREYFSTVNCFTRAIVDEGRIISFLHNSYKTDQLELLIQREETESVCILENIYTLSWWKNEPSVHATYIDGKYKVEIRAKEFDYHPPHFHVSYKECQAVFTLRNGELYKTGKDKFSQKELNIIYDWYRKNKEQLEEKWKELHT